MHQQWFVCPEEWPDNGDDPAGGGAAAPPSGVVNFAGPTGEADNPGEAPAENLTGVTADASTGGVGEPAAPDLLRLLRLLADHNVNLLAIGGSNIELRGEFSFVTDLSQSADDAANAHPHSHAHDHDPDDATLTARTTAIAGLESALRAGGYRFWYRDVEPIWVAAGVGGLRDAVASIEATNLAEARVIRDFTIGRSAYDGCLPVYVYSQRVKKTPTL